jgi:hypothetical protein
MNCALRKSTDMKLPIGHGFLNVHWEYVEIIRILYYRKIIIINVKIYIGWSFFSTHNRLYEFYVKPNIVFVYCCVHCSIRFLPFANVYNNSNNKNSSSNWYYILSKRIFCEFRIRTLQGYGISVTKDTWIFTLYFVVHKNATRYTFNVNNNAYYI